MNRAQRAAVLTPRSTVAPPMGRDLLLTLEFFWDYPTSSGTWANLGTAGTVGDLVNSGSVFDVDHWRMDGTSDRVATAGDVPAMNIEPTTDATWAMIAGLTVGQFADGSKPWSKYNAAPPGIWMEAFKVSGGVAIVVDISDTGFAHFIQANVSGANQGISGNKTMYGARQDGVARTVEQFADTSFTSPISNSSIPLTSLTNTQPFRMGSSAAGTGTLGDFYGGFFTRQKLTNAQLASIGSYFGCPAAAPPAELTGMGLWVDHKRNGGGAGWTNLGTAGAVANGTLAGGATWTNVNGLYVVNTVDNNGYVDFGSNSAVDPANGDFTAFCVVAIDDPCTTTRVWMNKWNGDGWLISNVDGSSTRKNFYFERVSGTSFGVSSGGPTITQNTYALYAVVRDRTAQTITAYTNGTAASTSDAALGTLTNALALRLGRTHDGATGVKMYAKAAGFVKSAYSAGQIAAIASYYGL